ncbi:MAG TPA: alpha/beta fold hydrolase [Planctomycetota bacterium]|nr:alpha/beta fold hydrolase [Planctomycetota bacterium]
MKFTRRLFFIIPLLIASVASAEENAPAKLSATGFIERFRRLKINVIAPAEWNGKTVKLQDGDKTLAKEKLMEQGAACAAKLTVPLTPETTFGKLTIEANGEKANVKVPNITTTRKDTFAAAPLLFRPFVFSGGKFPSCEFDEPSLVEDLIGEYTLHPVFYDAEYNEVKTPSKPGRYGAVVEIRTAAGVAGRRFATLYKQPEEFRFRRAEIPFTVELPKQLGIDPAVVKEQSGLVNDYFTTLLAVSTGKSGESAIFLAGLNEMKPGSGKAKQRESAAERNRHWWFGLKKKLGMVEHRYLSFVPDEAKRDPAKKFPLILFLHGSGERGTDLNLVKVHGPPKIVETEKGKTFPFIVISPQCPPGEWWLAADLNDLLDEVCAKLPVDSERIYLTGLSMGGFGSWNLAAQYPDRFAAVVPICGGGDPEDVERIKNLPIWVFHGAKDIAVPLKMSEDMIASLKKVGSSAKLTVYPNAGHDSWTETYNNDELYQWLLKQKRGQPPQW